MSKKIQAFTPVFDSVTKETDTEASLIYGYIWRKEKLARGWCDTAIKTMATELKVSQPTIKRRIALLESKGWIVDLDPDVTHRPHRRQTKRKISIVPMAVEEDIEVGQNEVPDGEVAQADTNEVAQADTQRYLVKDTKDSLPVGKKKSEFSIAMDILEQSFANTRQMPAPDWDSGSLSDKKVWQTRWRSPLSRMWKSAQKDTERSQATMLRAIQKMVSNDLTISAPQSVEAVFMSLLAEDKEYRGTGRIV